MTRLLPLPIALLLLAVSFACSQPTSGPVEVRWDRDMCERCRMTVSDQRFAAQVRLAESGRVRNFDDLGCALIWLDESGTQISEFWIRDHRSGKWLPARQAFYERAKGTPMDYGWGAVSEAGEESVDFAQVRERVRATERGVHARRDLP